MNTDERVSISLAEWYDNYALEIELKDEQSFLKIKETLTRIGVSSNKDNKLFQSCHILSKKDKYYIVHFKELFALDGKTVNLSTDDVYRRNTIAKLLEDWGLLDVVNDIDEEHVMPVNSIKIIKHSDKDNYDLISKYQIGSFNKENKIDQ